MSFKITEPYKEIELSRFGGLYTEADTRGLPTGSSPQNNDVDYLISLVGVRPGLRPAIAFGSGYSAFPSAAQAGNDWANPQNALGAPNGKFASVTPSSAGKQTFVASVTQPVPPPGTGVIVQQIPAFGLTALDCCCDFPLPAPLSSAVIPGGGGSGGGGGGGGGGGAGTTGKWTGMSGGGGGIPLPNAPIIWGGTVLGGVELGNQITSDITAPNGVFSLSRLRPGVPSVVLVPCYADNLSTEAAVFPVGITDNAGNTYTAITPQLTDTSSQNPPNPPHFNGFVIYAVILPNGYDLTIGPYVITFNWPVGRNILCDFPVVCLNCSSIDQVAFAQKDVGDGLLKVPAVTTTATDVLLTFWDGACCSGAYVPPTGSVQVLIDQSGTGGVVFGAATSGPTLLQPPGAYGGMTFPLPGAFGPSPTTFSCVTIALGILTPGTGGGGGPSTATTTVAPNGSSQMLVVPLALNIPAGAVITGIEVDINAQSSVLPASIAAILGSFVGGVFDVASEWEQVVIPNTIPDTVMLGGADDLWGGTWTPNELNSPYFALGIVAQEGTAVLGATITVDPTVTIYYTLSSDSSPLLLANYNFNIPAANPTGIELMLSGYETPTVAGIPAPPVVVQLVLNGVPIGVAKTVQLPSLPGSVPVGSLSDTWSVAGLAAIVTQPGFGVSIVADEGSITFIESAQMILSLGPTGAPFFGYMKSSALTGGQSLTLALDGAGNLWEEDTINRPGVMSTFYTAITPNSLAASETIAGREFFNFFNFQAMASDQPRAWDGTNLDRISQCGPGVGPSIIVDNASYNIAPSPFGLTQPFAPVNINFYEWGAAPSEGGSGKPGTVITIYGPENGPSSFINNINIGDNIYFVGLSNTVGGVNPNGTYPVIASGKFIRGSGNINYYISVIATSTQFQAVRSQSGATYQKTVGFVQLLNPIPPGLIQVGSQLTIAGAAPSTWDQTFTVLGTPTQGQLLITSTVLVGDIATYTYVVVSGVPPGWQATETVTIGQQLVDTNGNLWQVTGGTTFITGGSMPPFVTTPQTDGGVTWSKVVGSMLVTVFNTNNGGGIFNVSAQGIASATANTFTVDITAPDVPAAAEQGEAFSGQGTLFEIDPGANTVGSGNPGTNPILGNGGGGTVVIAGQIAPGERYAILMFETRNGLITPGSPPVQFFTSQSTNGIRFANLATGPPDVIARIVALTPAGAGIGGPYFYIENDVTVPNLISGGFSIFNKTVIPDNVSGTSNLINLSDAVLLTGVNVTEQGNNALQQRELGSSVKPVLFAGRAFYLGEQTKEDAFVNTSFDGGVIGSAPNIPAGWNVDLALNVLMTVNVSPISGNSVRIGNATGATFNPTGSPFASAHQAAYQNIFLSPIVQPNTAYSIRTQMRLVNAPNNLSGNMNFSFFSPTMGEWKFAIPLDNLTLQFQYFSGPLNNPLWSTVPTDLQLRFYPSDMLDGTAIEIDRFDVFFTEEPVYTTQIFGSYFEDYEAIDAVTGPIDTSEETAAAQTNAFEWNDSLYITTGGRTMIVEDNGSTEPEGWKVRTVSEKAGCFGPLAADVGEQYVVQAEQKGFYIFDGGNHEKISQEIQQVWNLIYKPAFKTVWVLNDLIQKRFMIGVPMATPNPYLPNAPVNTNPTTPNVILMCSYLGLETAKEIAASAPIHVSMFTGNLLARDMVRKWTIWQIPSPNAARISRPTAPQQLWFGGTIGVGKIYNLDPTAFDDDGNVIPELYTTFDFSDPATNQGLGLGSVRKLYPYMSVLIEGTGAYVLTAFPETLQAPAAYQIVAPPKKLKNPALSDPNVPLNITGNRVFLQFGVDGNLGSNFLLKNIVLACIRDTKMPVSGIDTT